MDTHDDPERRTPDLGDAQSADRGETGNADQRHDGGKHGHAAAEITPPPKLAAAPPRTALLMVGLVLLVLAVAGGVTMLLRIHGDHVLAETDRAELRAHRGRDASHGRKAG